MKVLFVNEHAFDSSVLQKFVDAGECYLLDVDIPLTQMEKPALQIDSKKFHPLPLHKAKEYIDHHYMDSSCSLSDVARSIYMSSSHLSFIFKENIGTSFINYLTEIRIQTAKQLLSSTDLMVYEISSRVGYDNPAYFSTIFKKSTGQTPKDYRNEKRDYQI